MAAGEKPQPSPAPLSAQYRRQVGRSPKGGRKFRVSAHSPPQEERAPDLPSLMPRRARGSAGPQKPPVSLPPGRSASPTLLPPQPPSRASPGAGSAGTSLWRRPGLCSPATQFSGQFPTLIPPRKIKPGSQAEAGSALATHAGALGRAHRPLGARSCSCCRSRRCGLRPSGPHWWAPQAQLLREPARRRRALGDCARGQRSNPPASAAGAGRRGRGDSDRTPLGDPRARRQSWANKSRRAAFLCSSPGPPPLRVFPEAAAGEMQVARRPPLTPHKQTRRFRGYSRKTRLRLRPGARRLPGRKGERG